MDGDWETVKKPVKKAKPQEQVQTSGPATFGGKKGKNVLVAGAVQQKKKYGGPAARGNQNLSSAAAAFQEEEVYNHAS